MSQVMSTGQLVGVVLDHILLLRIIGDLTVQEAKVVMVQGMADGHPLLIILGTCQMVTRHQQVTGVQLSLLKCQLPYRYNKRECGL